MPSRDQQKERTRARILDAAAELFAAEGIAKVRTLDVARAARLSHGAVFVHFPTREDLVSAVIERFALRVTSRLHDLAAERASLREVLAAHLEGLAEHEALYARLVIEGPTLGSHARSTLLAIQSAIAHHIAEAVRVEALAGSVRSMPFPLLFNTWLGLVHHYVSNRDLFAPDGSSLERHGPALLDHFMGLLAP